MSPNAFYRTSWYQGAEGALAPFDYQDWKRRHAQQKHAMCSRSSPTATKIDESLFLPHKDALSTDDEYSTVIRAFSDVSVPNGYRHVDANDALPLVKYAREMTLARGRILYEIRDRWTNCFVGYIVPSVVFSEALSYRSTCDGWDRLPSHDCTARSHAHTLILEQFPRIVPVAAKVVTEKMIVEKRGLTHRNVEQSVVNHIRHCWTSYELCFEKKDRHGRYAKEDILETIRPRMRAVLLKWLPEDTGETKLVMLWRRHHLLDSDKGNGVCKEDDMFYTPTTLTWCGGKETAANLGRTERAFL